MHRIFKFELCNLVIQKISVIVVVMHWCMLLCNYKSSGFQLLNKEFQVMFKDLVICFFFPGVLFKFVLSEKVIKVYASDSLTRVTDRKSVV